MKCVSSSICHIPPSDVDVVVFDTGYQINEWMKWQE